MAYVKYNGKMEYWFDAPTAKQRAKYLVSSQEAMSVLVYGCEMNKLGTVRRTKKGIVYKSVKGTEKVLSEY